MKPLISFACAACLIALSTCWAGERETRFVEIPYSSGTSTFDLSTVQMIQPGRFVVISTMIDDPDVMRLELRALDIGRAHCSRPGGKYPAPADLFALGPPDMPVKGIEVIEGDTYKFVLLYYPYKRLGAKDVAYVQCNRTSDKDIREIRALIMNGLRSKQLFDCRRGLMGTYIVGDESRDPITYFVRPDTLGEDMYRRVCYAVTGDMPYLPEQPGKEPKAAPFAPK